MWAARDYGNDLCGDFTSYAEKWGGVLFAICARNKVAVKLSLGGMGVFPEAKMLMHCFRGDGG